MAPYGYTYASVRPLGEGEGNYVRTYHYVMPTTRSAPFRTSPMRAP